MSKQPAPLYLPGQHGLLDLYGCPAELLSDAHALQSALQHAAQLIGATVLFAHFHDFGANAGVTGVLLLAESHISIHTWAEHQFAAIDIFVCGQQEMTRAAEFLQQALHAQHMIWHNHARGAQLLS